MIRKITRAACFLAAVPALFFSIAPFAVYGVFGVGGALLFAAGIFFLFLPFLISWLRKKGKRGVVWMRVLLVFLAAGLLSCGTLAMVMVGTAHGRGYDPMQPPKTVLVLGCQVRGTQPSLMLQRRLDAAYQYLVQYPETMCIVSGGQGSDEDLPEGEAMARYLQEKGIDPQRIYRETESSNTKENFLFSTRIIEREGLSREITVVTDGFHQLRASLFAKDHQLGFHALPANTPWLLAPGYYVREMLGIVKSALLDRT